MGNKLKFCNLAEKLMARFRSFFRRYYNGMHSYARKWTVVQLAWNLILFDVWNDAWLIMCEIELIFKTFPFWNTFKYLKYHATYDAPSKQGCIFCFARKIQMEAYFDIFANLNWFSELSPLRFLQNVKSFNILNQIPLLSWIHLVLVMFWPEADRRKAGHVNANNLSGTSSLSRIF